MRPQAKTQRCCCCSGLPATSGRATRAPTAWSPVAYTSVTKPGKLHPSAFQKTATRRPTRLPAPPARLASCWRARAPHAPPHCCCAAPRVADGGGGGGGASSPVSRSQRAPCRSIRCADGPAAAAGAAFLLPAGSAASSSRHSTAPSGALSACIRVGSVGSVGAEARQECCCETPATGCGPR